MFVQRAGGLKISAHKIKGYCMNKKQTSPKVATTASKILKDKRSSNKAKSVAGSALSQTKTTKKSK